MHAGRRREPLLSPCAFSPYRRSVDCVQRPAQRQRAVARWQQWPDSDREALGRSILQLQSELAEWDAQRDLPDPLIRLVEGGIEVERSVVDANTTTVVASAGTGGYSCS